MKSIEKLKQFMSEEDTKLICELISDTEEHFDKHIKISISSTLMTYNIPKLLDENEIIYIQDNKKNKYIVPSKYEKYIHECELYKGYVADNQPILFGIKFKDSDEIGIIYHMIEDNHDEEILINSFALKTLNCMKHDKIIDMIKDYSQDNRKKKEDKKEMNENSKLWVPEINPEQNPEFLYPLSAYKTLRTRIKETFYNSSYLLLGLEEENSFTTTGEENNIKYVKVKTTNENQNVFIPINKDNEPVLGHIKTTDQSFIKLELNIINKEINFKGIATVIYSNNEVYMSISDVHMISMLQPNDIKDLLVEATTEQYVNNKSRKRSNKKKH